FQVTHLRHYVGCVHYQYAAIVVMRRKLLVAQRLDGIEVRSFEGGIGAKNNSNYGADDEAKDRPINRNDRGYFQKIGRNISGGDAENDADDAAEFGKDDSFDDELGEDVALFGPDSATDADFFGPLRYGNEHDIHNADAGGEEGDGTDKSDPG